MEDISQEVVKLSKINSAALINIRINNIWIEVNKTAVGGNYFRWNSYLDRIWCELVGDIKKNSDNRTKFNELNKDVSEKLKGLKIIKGFSQYSKEDKEKMSEIYDSIMKKEDFLRTLMNEQGKGTAYQEESDWD